MAMGRHKNRKGLYSCVQCGREYQFLNALQSHEALHAQAYLAQMSMESSSSSDDDSSASDSAASSKGSRSSSKQNTLKWDIFSKQAKYCSKCNLTFTSNGELKQHMKAGVHKNSQGWYKCGSCSQQFRFLRTLEVHKQVQHEGVKYTEVTAKTNVYDSDSYQGSSESHSDISDPEQATVESVQPRKATQKKKAIPKKVAPKKRHIPVHPEKRCRVDFSDPHYCQQCDRSFAMKSLFHKHMMGGRHKNTKGLYPCPICLKEFQFEKALQSHEALHGGPQIFQAAQENLVFRQADQALTELELKQKSKAVVAREDKRFKTYPMEKVTFKEILYPNKSRKWVINKYIFIKNVENDFKIHLRCRQRNICNIVAHINKQENCAYIKTGEHPHPPPSLDQLNLTEKLMMLSASMDGAEELITPRSSLPEATATCKRASMYDTTKALSKPQKVVENIMDVVVKGKEVVIHTFPKSSGSSKTRQLEIKEQIEEYDKKQKQNVSEENKHDKNVEEDKQDPEEAQKLIQIGVEKHWVEVDVNPLEKQDHIEINDQPSEKQQQAEGEQKRLEKRVEEKNKQDLEKRVMENKTSLEKGGQKHDKIEEAKEAEFENMQSPHGKMVQVNVDDVKQTDDEDKSEVEGKKQHADIQHEKGQEYLNEQSPDCEKGEQIRVQKRQSSEIEKDTGQQFQQIHGVVTEEKQLDIMHEVLPADKNRTPVEIEKLVSNIIQKQQSKSALCEVVTERQAYGEKEMQKEAETQKASEKLVLQESEKDIVEKTDNQELSSVEKKGKQMGKDIVEKTDNQELSSVEKKGKQMGKDIVEKTDNQELSSVEKKGKQMGKGNVNKVSQDETKNPSEHVKELLKGCDGKQNDEKKGVETLQENANCNKKITKDGTVPSLSAKQKDFVLHGEQLQLKSNEMETCPEVETTTFNNEESSCRTDVSTLGSGERTLDKCSAKEYIVEKIIVQASPSKLQDMDVIEDKNKEKPTSGDINITAKKELCTFVDQPDIVDNKDKNEDDIQMSDDVKNSSASGDQPDIVDNKDKNEDDIQMSDDVKNSSASGDQPDIVDNKDKNEDDIQMSDDVKNSSASGDQPVVDMINDSKEDEKGISDVKKIAIDEQLGSAGDHTYVNVMNDKKESEKGMSDDLRIATEEELDSSGDHTYVDVIKDKKKRISDGIEGETGQESDMSGDPPDVDVFKDKNEDEKAIRDVIESVSKLKPDILKNELDSCVIKDMKEDGKRIPEALEIVEGKESSDTSQDQPQSSEETNSTDKSFLGYEGSMLCQAKRDLSLGELESRDKIAYKQIKEMHSERILESNLSSDQLESCESIDPSKKASSNAEEVFDSETDGGVKLSTEAVGATDRRKSVGKDGKRPDDEGYNIENGKLESPPKKCANESGRATEYLSSDNYKSGKTDSSDEEPTFCDMDYASDSPASTGCLQINDTLDVQFPMSPLEHQSKDIQSTEMKTLKLDKSAIPQSQLTESVVISSILQKSPCGLEQEKLDPEVEIEVENASSNDNNKMTPEKAPKEKKIQKKQATSDEAEEPAIGHTQLQQPDSKFTTCEKIFGGQSRSTEEKDVGHSLQCTSDQLLAVDKMKSATTKESENSVSAVSPNEVHQDDSTKDPGINTRHFHSITDTSHKIEMPTSTSKMDINITECSTKANTIFAPEASSSSDNREAVVSHEKQSSAMTSKVFHKDDSAVEKPTVTTESWYCQQCDRFFASQVHLDKHNDIGRHFCRNADGVYQCRFCKTDFSSIGGVIYHESICGKTHTSIEDDNEVDSSDQIPTSTSTSKKMTLKKQSPNGNKASVSETVPLTSVSGDINTIDTSHEIEMTASTSKECSTMKKQTSEKQQPTSSKKVDANHEAINKDDSTVKKKNSTIESWYCQQCDKFFASGADLEKHNEVGHHSCKTAKRVYPCKFCKTDFTSIVSVIHHEFMCGKAHTSIEVINNSDISNQIQASTSSSKNEMIKEQSATSHEIEMTDSTSKTEISKKRRTMKNKTPEKQATSSNDATHELNNSVLASKVINKDDSTVEKKHTATESWYCKPCDRFFASKAHLDKHNEIGRHFCKNENGVYQCRFCKTDFSSIGGVIYHESICGKTHTNSQNNGKSETKKAKKVSPPAIHCTSKIKFVHEKKKNDADTSAMTKGNNFTASKEKQDKNKLTDKGSSSTSAVEEQNTNGKLGPPKRSVPSLHCKICKKIFTTSSHFRQHMVQGRHINAHGRYKCLYCMTTLPTVSRIKAHERASCSKRPKSTNRTSIVVPKSATFCKICNRTFSNVRLFAKHMSADMHLNSKGIYSCGICSAEFKFIGFLQAHQSEHKDLGPLQHHSKLVQKTSLTKDIADVSQSASQLEDKESNSTGRQVIQGKRKRADSLSPMPRKRSRNQSLDDQVAQNILWTSQPRLRVRTKRGVGSPSMLKETPSKQMHRMKQSIGITPKDSQPRLRERSRRSNVSPSMLKHTPSVQLRTNKLGAKVTPRESQLRLRERRCDASPSMQKPTASKQLHKDKQNVEGTTGDSQPRIRERRTRSDVSPSLLKETPSVQLHSNNQSVEVNPGEAQTRLQERRTRSGVRPSMLRQTTSKQTHKYKHSAEVTPRTPPTVPIQVTAKKRKGYVSKSQQLKTTNLSKISNADNQSAKKYPEMFTQDTKETIAPATNKTPGIVKPDSKESPGANDTLRSFTPGTLFCKVCNLVFKNVGAIGKHVNVCHTFKINKKGIGCKGCKRAFPSVSAATEHESLCKAKKSLSKECSGFCKLCKMVFERIDVHVKQGYHVNTRGAYSCRLCNKEFEHIDDVGNHERTTCPQRKQVAKANSKYCQQCHRTFATYGSCQAHMAAGRHKNNKGLYPCSECGKEFQYEKALVSHEQIEHASGDEEVTVEFRHGYGLDQDPTTTEVSSSISIQETIIETNTEDSIALSIPDSWPCELCEETFNTKSCLEKHTKDCYTNSCRFCNTRFSEKTSVQIHEAKYCTKVYVDGDRSNERCRDLTESDTVEENKNETNSNFETKLMKDDVIELDVVSVDDVCEHSFEDKTKTVEDDVTEEILVCKGNVKNKKKTLKDDVLKIHVDDRSSVENKSKTIVKCQLCDQSFPDYILYQMHKKEEHSQHSTTSHNFCGVCGKTFNSTRVFLNHAKSCDNTVCKTEKKPAFDHKKDLLMDSELPKKQQLAYKMTYACDICGKTFHSKLGRQNHIRAHESLLTKKFLKPSSKCCSFCTRECSTLKELTLHEAKHTESDMYCGLCDHNFQSAFVFRSHQEKGYHKEKNRSGKYTCSMCRAAFPTLLRICYHENHCKLPPVHEQTGAAGEIHSLEVQSTTPQESLTCKACDIDFPDGFQYEYHMDAGYHTNKDGVYICQFCKQPFGNVSKLKNHEKMHLKVPNALNTDRQTIISAKARLDKGGMYCEFCELQFKSAFRFRSHHEKGYHKKKSRSGEYTCDVCGANFSTLLKICRHENHCKLRLIDEQTKAAGKSHSLEVQSTTPQESLTCKACGIDFPDDFEYECHMDAGYHKNKDGVYSCTFCKLSFRKMPILKNHEKNHMSKVMSYSEYPKPLHYADNINISGRSAGVSTSMKLSARFRKTFKRKLTAVSTSPPETRSSKTRKLEASPPKGEKSAEKQCQTSGKKKLETKTNAQQKNVFQKDMESGNVETNEKNNMEANGKVYKEGLRQRKSCLNCKYCLKKFSWRANLLKHERDDHALVVAENPILTTDESVPSVKEPGAKTTTNVDQITTESDSPRGISFGNVLPESGSSRTGSPEQKAKYYCVFGCDPPLEKTFPSRENLWFHAMMEHKGTSNQCAVCKIKFSTWGKVNKHLENRHKIEPVKNNEYLCVFGCAYNVFTSLKALECHAQSEHKNYCNLCSHCNRAFSTSTQTLQHVGKAHIIRHSQGSHSLPRDSKSMPTSSKNEPRKKATELEHQVDRFLCTFGCEMKLFVLLSDLASHAHSVHNDLEVCNLCEINFGSCKSVVQHIGRCHKIKCQLSVHSEDDTNKQTTVPEMCFPQVQHQDTSCDTETQAIQQTEMSPSKIVQNSQKKGQDKDTLKEMYTISHQQEDEVHFLCTFGCKMMTFQYLTDLKNHACYSHKDKSKCQKCQVQFKDWIEVVEHISKYHMTLVKKNVTNAELLTQQHFDKSDTSLVEKNSSSANANQMSLPHSQQQLCHDKSATPVQQFSSERPSQITHKDSRQNQTKKTTLLDTFKVEEHFLCTYGCQTKTFSLLNDLLNHALQEHSAITMCKVCYIDLGTCENVAKHIGMYHKVNVCKMASDKSPPQTVPDSSTSPTDFEPSFSCHQLASSSQSKTNVGDDVSLKEKISSYQNNTASHLSEVDVPSTSGLSLGEPTVNVASSSSEVTTTTQEYRCTFGCDNKSFLSFKSLLYHTRVRHCLLCQLTFSNFDSAQLHAQKKHKIVLKHSLPDNVCSDAVVIIKKLLNQDNLVTIRKLDTQDISTSGTLDSKQIGNGAAHVLVKSHNPSVGLSIGSVLALNKDKAQSHVDEGLQDSSNGSKNVHKVVSTKKLSVDENGNSKSYKKPDSKYQQLSVDRLAGESDGRSTFETMQRVEDTSDDNEFSDNILIIDENVNATASNVTEFSDKALVIDESVQQVTSAKASELSNKSQIIDEHVNATSAKATGSASGLNGSSNINTSSKLLLVKKSSTNMKKAGHSALIKMSLEGKEATSGVAIQSSLSQSSSSAINTSLKLPSGEKTFSNTKNSAESALVKNSIGKVASIKKSSAVFTADDFFNNCSMCGQQFSKNKYKSDHLKSGLCSGQLIKKKARTKSGDRAMKDTMKVFGGDSLSTQIMLSTEPSSSKTTMDVLPFTGAGDSTKGQLQRSPSPSCPTPDPSPVKNLSQASKMRYEEHFLCTFGCEMTTFSKFNDLRNHARDVHKGEKRCTPCKMQLDTFSSALEHIRERHKIWCMVVEDKPKTLPRDYLA